MGVIPANAGIQAFKNCANSCTDWMPAFAGMTPSKIAACHVLTYFSIGV